MENERSISMGMAWVFGVFGGDGLFVDLVACDGHYAFYHPAHGEAGTQEKDDAESGEVNLNGSSIHGFFVVGLQFLKCSTRLKVGTALLKILSASKNLIYRTPLMYNYREDGNMFGTYQQCAKCQNQECGVAAKEV